MAGTTIDRTWYNTLVDDDGTNTTGSVWDKADVDSLLDAIDAIFSGATLVLDQGANDVPILQLRSSDIAHGMTSVVNTDTFGYFQKTDANAGGMSVVGLSESNSYGLQIKGVGGVDDTTKTTGALGAIIFDAAKKSGTTWADLAANANMAVFRTNGGVARFILDNDGDSHQDVGTAWTNFDDHNDVELLHALSAGVSRKGDPLRRAFGRLLTKHRPTLERARIVTFNKDGHHFVNWSRLHMLMVGAVRQQATELQKTHAKVVRLERRVAKVQRRQIRGRAA